MIATAGALERLVWELRRGGAPSTVLPPDLSDLRTGPRLLDERSSGEPAGSSAAAGCRGREGELIA